MSKESLLLKFVKKDLLMIIGLAIIFIAVFVAIYIYDIKTNGFNEQASNLYSFLLN